MTPARDVIELLERAVSQGVSLDSDGSALFMVGVPPRSLATLIHARRAELIRLLAAQRCIGDLDLWGGPHAIAEPQTSKGEHRG